MLNDGASRKGVRVGKSFAIQIFDEINYVNLKNLRKERKILAHMQRKKTSKEEEVKEGRRSSNHVFCIEKEHRLCLTCLIGSWPV